MTVQPDAGVVGVGKFPGSPTKKLNTARKKAVSLAFVGVPVTETDVPVPCVLVVPESTPAVFGGPARTRLDPTGLGMKLKIGFMAVPLCAVVKSGGRFPSVTLFNVPGGVH